MVREDLNIEREIYGGVQSKDSSNAQYTSSET